MRIKVIKIFLDAACAELNKCESIKDLRETRKDLINVVLDMGNHDTVSGDMEVFLIRRLRNMYYTIKHHKFGFKVNNYKRFLY